MSNPRRLALWLGLATVVLGYADYSFPVVLSLFYALICLVAGWGLGLWGAGIFVLASLGVHCVAEWVDKPVGHWTPEEIVNDALRVALWVLVSLGSLWMRRAHDEVQRARQSLAEAQRSLGLQLEWARRVQRGLLTSRFVQGPELDAAMRYEVALQLGGDFYELAPARGGWVAIVGDVSGKGPSAALLAALLRGLVDDLLKQNLSPEDMLGRIEERLHPWLPDEMFVTCFCARYDRARQTLQYASAGHEPGLLRKASGELQELLTTGLPLGVAPELPLGLAEVPFDPGDLLLLYTDGLVDAPGVGRERLAHCLQRGVTSSQAMVDRIFSLSHRLTEEPVDDVMVLVLRSQAPEEAEESLMDLVAELMPPGRVG